MRPVTASLASLLLIVTAGIAAAQADGAAIQNALSAAPPAIAAKATVMDGKHQVLRQGTNGWTCMPDDPAVPNNSPMCLDKPWLEFMGALMSKQQPHLTTVGVAYMLQGDMPVSNTDPFATAPTATNQWIDNSGPHIMIAVPDPSALAGLPTDPKNGGPWVMWKGTPYAHIMVPVK
ncbi:MAG TPA: hypothetical protein VFS05_01795 [Gemmatimonadaceae bacterium]|nr:hypothetical protein [Gemmatimonadaceae bacterium]